MFFIIKVPLQMALALGLALLVVRPGRGFNILRAVILFPTVTSMVVASTTWGYMMHPQNGLINSVLEIVRAT
ncbi:MAG: sugar ABC transporter permease [Chloroflexi bacterium]|nr:sugar ABC transporter permease [Chloroflexota bacterium]